MTRTARLKACLVLVLVTMAVLNLRLLLRGSDYTARGFADFTAFYTAGKMLQRGQSGGLYDRKLQWEVQQEFAGTVNIRVGPLPYIRPPFHSVIFLPLAYLRYRTAYLVWMAIKISILLLIPFLLRPYLPGTAVLPPWLAALLSLAVAPVAVDLLQGQDAILFLLVCVGAFIASVQEDEFLSGVYLGLGLFKFNLILPIILVLALRKKGRTLLGFTLAGLGLLLISAYLVGWAGLRQYPAYLWDLSHSSGTGVVLPQNMPNLRGLLSLLLSAHVSPRWMDWIYAPLAILGVVSVAMVWKRKALPGNDSLALGFSLNLVMAILVSPYCSGYDRTLLLLPLFVLADYFLGSKPFLVWLKVSLFSLFGVLLFLPVSWDFAGIWAIPTLLLVATIARSVRLTSANFTVQSQHEVEAI